MPLRHSNLLNRCSFTRLFHSSESSLWIIFKIGIPHFIFMCKCLDHLNASLSFWEKKIRGFSLCYQYDWKVETLISIGTTYNPCLEGYRGVFILKYIISALLNYVTTKWLSQNFYWVCLRKWWVLERWLVALQSLSTIKKDTSPFHF